MNLSFVIGLPSSSLIPSSHPSREASSSAHQRGHGQIVACSKCDRRQMMSLSSLLVGGFLPTSVSAQKEETGENVGRKPFYNKMFAESMEYGMSSYEEEIQERKRKLFHDNVFRGDRILEMGIGTGPNLRFLPEGVEVVGIEPNKAMHPYAFAKCPAGIDLKITAASAENSGFPTGTFDVVICTLLLCSVCSPNAVLKEAMRNLRSGGKLLLCEHVAAPDGTLLLAAQTLLNPLQRLVADNCRLTRRTKRDLFDVFDVAEVEEFRVEDANAVLISPHIIGSATKS